jgi:hypothetical protein
MVTGVTSLSLVRDELFATIDDAELSLEHFIAERDNGSLLQQAVENLQQVRGTLKLIELAGAEMLAQEALQQTTDIPVGAGEDRNAQLSSLSNALHVLRRYLEIMDAHRQEVPELLLPAINHLREAGGQPALPESFFFSVRLDHPRPPSISPAMAVEPDSIEVKRLRHMYQIGLVGFLREENAVASLKLMLRAMTRLDTLLANDERGRLCWIAAAALEAQLDGQLIPRPARKMLFARLDRELKQLLLSSSYEPPRNLLKELLYIVVLADSHGPRATQIREVFSLLPLPFTDHLLEESYQRLSGPGEAVMHSLTSAIREELNSLKDQLDLIERGTVSEEGLSQLHAIVGKMAKTLGMVGLSSAGNTLQTQLPLVTAWIDNEPIEPHQLIKFADAVLYVESMVASLTRNGRYDSQPSLGKGSEITSFADHQLYEARIVVIDEAIGAIALAKRSITAFLESDGDKLNLANVPFSLDAVRGGLWFLDQPRAARLVGACGEYIDKQMLQSPQVPSEQMLETLADALTSLEYYLEGGGVLRPETSPSVLDLAAESVRALGVSVPV